MIKKYSICEFLFWMDLCIYACMQMYLCVCVCDVNIQKFVNNCIQFCTDSAIFDKSLFTCTKRRATFYTQLRACIVYAL